VIGSHHESDPVEGAVIATVAQRRDAGASTARCDHAAAPLRRMLSVDSERRAVAAYASLRLRKHPSDGALQRDQRVAIDPRRV
jgi:hypothetical protein